MNLKISAGGRTMPPRPPIKTSPPLHLLSKFSTKVRKALKIVPLNTLIISDNPYKQVLVCTRPNALDAHIPKITLFS